MPGPRAARAWWSTCEQVPLIDSAGLELLLDMQEPFESARRRDEARRRATRLCSDILRVTGVGRQFEIYREVRLRRGELRAMSATADHARPTGVRPGCRRRAIAARAVQASAALPLGEQLVGAKLIAAGRAEAALEPPGARRPAAGRNAARAGLRQRRESCCRSSSSSSACRRSGCAKV